jgi:hypothetical protein
MLPKSSLRLSVVALLLAAVACSDTGLEPKSAPTTISASLIGTKSHAKGDTTVTSFTIDPTTATTFDVGSSHTLYIPAHGVCDLATSSYGPSEWDRPCAAMTAPLVITAKSWKNAAGLPQVDFSPSLRFNPAARGIVVLALRVTSRRELRDNASILYCPTANSVCVNEAQADPSLATFVDEKDSYVFRRIKHFSGYNVSSGRVPPADLPFEQ